MNTRRNFLKKTGLFTAGLALASSLNTPRVHAAEKNRIDIALVGCGSRGGGAVLDALDALPSNRLVAVADVFQDKVDLYSKLFKEQRPDQVDLPNDRRFIGFNAYKQAIDAVGPGGVVLLCTPPAFRAPHFEYAVEKGVHVFMEKAFGVDVPGIRRILRAGEKATEKNLKIAGGLMSRHSVPLQECIKQIHDGIIGEITTIFAYRVHGPVPFINRKPGENELAHQIRNYHNFTWTNGTFIADWLIHNLDNACWTKNAWPISAQGQGGRQVRTEPDQLFDHTAVEYLFPDGTRLVAQGRGQKNTWGFFGNIAFGTKGSALLGEGVAKPKIFKGYKQSNENVIWEYSEKSLSPYKQEHVNFFDALVHDKPYNETERCAFATLVGAIGRMAAESGEEITWDGAMAITETLADVDSMTWDSAPPVTPDAEGRYPVALPGITKPV